MSTLRLALLLLLSAGAAQASTWADLWWTRDQQGQRLLDARNPAAAAQVFSDSRRRGYAELEAGHYAAAAKLLAPYKDVDSQYNRGNALAHTGQLREALGAYDAALASAPGDRDIIKNRDLVKRALDQQREARHQQPGGGKQQDVARNGSGEGRGSQSTDRTNGPEGSKRGSANSQSSQPGGNTQHTPGSAALDRRSQQGQSQGGQQTATEQEASGRGQGADQTASASGQARGNNGATAAQSQDGAPQPANPDLTRGQPAAQNQQLDGSQRGGPSPQGPGKSVGGDKIAAGPHGQTSIARGNPGRAGQTSDDDRETIRSEGMSTLQNQHARQSGQPLHQDSRSEQALALDQWLRTIPEDSGELLQRKFMIEHLMKQRGNTP